MRVPKGVKSFSVSYHVWEVTCISSDGLFAFKRCFSDSSTLNKFISRTRYRISDVKYICHYLFDYGTECDS